MWGLGKRWQGQLGRGLRVPGGHQKVSVKQRVPLVSRMLLPKWRGDCCCGVQVTLLLMNLQELPLPGHRVQEMRSSGHSQPPHWLQAAHPPSLWIQTHVAADLFRASDCVCVTASSPAPPMEALSSTLPRTVPRLSPTLSHSCTRHHHQPILQPRVTHREAKPHTQVTQLENDEAGLGTREASHGFVCPHHSLGLPALPFTGYCTPGQVPGPGASIQPARGEHQARTVTQRVDNEPITPV